LAIDIDSLHTVLKDPTRRKILAALNDKGTISYVEMLELLEIEHTGKLNYHLKQLRDLISKDGDGRYVLTEKGKLACQVMSRFQPDPPKGGWISHLMSRTSLGKLLLVLSIPSAILSITRLSGDYLLATRMSVVLGIATVLLLFFGLMQLMPSVRSGGGFASLRQITAYGSLELALLMAIGLISMHAEMGGLGVIIPLWISDWQWNAFTIYHPVIPGGLTWFAIAFRSPAGSFKEVLKVPLVATAILLIGEFVMINVVSLFFSPKVSTIEIFLSGIIPSIPMVAFLFIGFVVAEGFYRFVQWNGLK